MGVNYCYHTIMYCVLTLISCLISLSYECCNTKVVEGTDELAGTYNLYSGNANFLDVCMDQCAYTREGNPDSSNSFVSVQKEHTMIQSAQTPALLLPLVQVPVPTARIMYPGESTKSPYPWGHLSPLLP